MAATTILDAVTVDTESSLQEMTGNFEVDVHGDLGGGTVEIQKAVANDTDELKPIGIDGQFRGAGCCAVTNTGTAYYRAVLKGTTREANATVKFTQ